MRQYDTRIVVIVVLPNTVGSILVIRTGCYDVLCQKDSLLCYYKVSFKEYFFGYSRNIYISIYNVYK